MTSDSSPSTAAAIDAVAPAVLGIGMTHRARSQSVLARHWSPVGVVGAVGRASVGFGLAVGRSQSIRPTVRVDDLNSAALRPSFDVARRYRGVDDPIAGDETLVRRSPDLTADSTDTAGEGRRARPVDVSKPSAAASRASIERARRHPKRRARPTWTDQIIQRSSSAASAGSTPSGSVASSPSVAAVPDGFVSSGDAKLDQLRLLANAHGAGAAPRSPAAERSSTDGERRAGTPTAPSGPSGRTSSAEPAVAIPVGGPGRLARAMRPESAVPPAVPSARLGGPPAPLTAGAGGASARSSSQVRRSNRATAPSRVDNLRSMLIEQGFLDAGPDEAGAGPAPAATGLIDAAPRPSSPTGRVGESVDTAAPRQPTHISSDLRRAAGTDGRRATTTPDTPGAPVPQRDVTATALSSATPGPGPSGGREPSPPASSSTATSASPVVRRAVDPSTPVRPAVDGRGAVALAERDVETLVPSAVTTTALIPATTTPATTTPATTTPATTTPATTTPATTTPATTTPATTTPATTTTALAPAATRPPGVAAQQLRVQRLLRSGLVTDTSVPETFTTSEPSTEAGSTAVVAPAAEAVRTSASIDTVAARPTSLLAQRPGLDAWVPSLTRTDSGPSTVIRRVTLPRALSSAHRPAPQLGATDARDVPGTTHTSPVTQGRQAQRVSTISLGEAAAADSVTPRATSTDGAPNSPVLPAGPPRPADARPLLQVVRRLAATDAPAAPNQRTTTAATTTAATTTTSVEADAARGEVMRSAARARPDAQDGDTHLGAPGGESAERAPAEHVADQFMSVLSETVRRRPAPLPTTYRPLADAIAGPRPVMLSTDSASRKALRSVGKVAATTGDTIHLDQRSIPSARLAEVMAHELTHIAHPSPTPRFFDDIDDSPEERRAEQVAKVMARSPLAPSATTSAPPTRRRRDEGTIRRSPTSGSGTVSAAALAASLTRTGGEQVQRWETATPSAKRPQIGSRRSGQTSSSSSTSTSSSNSRSQAESTSFDGPSAAAEPSAEWFRTNLDANIDRIIRLVEDRMIVELERRGGRSWRST